MQKLVIVYDAGDGYECAYTAHIPIAYESAEALFVHLEGAIKGYLEGKGWHPPIHELGEDFTFFVSKDRVKNYKNLGYSVYKIGEHSYRSYELPEILTLEEWFNEYMVNKRA